MHVQKKIEAAQNLLGQTKKCVSGFMLLKIGVGRSDYFFIF